MKTISQKKIKKIKPKKSVKELYNVYESEAK